MHASKQALFRVVVCSLVLVWFVGQHLGIDSVLTDFTRYLSFRPADDAVRLVYHALLRCAPTVLKQPTQLVSQLYGRLSLRGVTAHVYSVFDQEHDFYSRLVQPRTWLEAVRPALLPVVNGPLERPGNTHHTPRSRRERKLLGLLVLT